VLVNADQFIAARVSAETKRQLRMLAERQQLSESALLKRLLETALMAAGPLAAEALDDPPKPLRTGRLYVRLRPDDQLFLTERATARGMAAATYVSVLTRAHLRGLAPLPEQELLALKRSVAELGALSRHLLQLLRVANAGTALSDGQAEFRAMLRIAEALRDHVKALLRANQASWEVGYAQKSH
jgi:hypothetical protein